MFSPLVTFPALYTATLLMLAGSGLFTTYIGLRLTQEGAGDLWVGGLMASYYFGLVCGGKFGHKLIASFGHIRSYVACAGIATVTVLLHALVDQLEVWLLLRFITGAVMMNQYMVIESWLNEQAES
ncbi:MFS transporter, partial [Pseudomonas aeruginosa]